MNTIEKKYENNDSIHNILNDLKQLNLSNNYIIIYSTEEKAYVALI